MTIRDIVENLPAHVVYGPPGFIEHTVHRVIAGDLMSDMLLSVEGDALMVTSLATEQTVRSADLICAPAILLVNDKLPTLEMKKLAETCGITLLATPMPMFESCTTLGFLQNSCHDAQ